MERTVLALLVILLCAAETRAAGPTAEAIAGQLSVHRGALDAEAPQALLTSLKAVAEDPAAAPEQSFASLALIQSMTSPENLASLEDYLTEHGSPAEADALKGDLASLSRLFKTIQDDPVAKKDFLAAGRSLQRRLTKTGAIDESRLRALFDGSLADGDGETAAVKAVPIGGGPLIVPPRAIGLEPSQPWPRKSRAEPPAPGRELVLAEPRAQLEPEAPLTELTEKEKKRVEDKVALILSLEDVGNPEDGSQRRQAQGEVRRWGEEEQRRAGELSPELEKLIAESQAEASRTPALVKLRQQAEAMDPAQIERKQGFMRRQIARLRGATPVDRYVADYSKQQQSVKEIVAALEMERDQLLARDEVFEAELHRTSRSQEALERAIEKLLYAGSLFERKLQNGELSRDMRAFVVSKLLPGILEREESLREQLTTIHNSQISLATRLNSNRKMMKIYERAISTVPRALQIAQVVRLGEEAEQRGLDMSDAINKEALETLKRSYEELKSVTDAAAGKEGAIYVGGSAIDPPGRETALQELKKVDF